MPAASRTKSRLEGWMGMGDVVRAARWMLCLKRSILRLVVNFSRRALRMERWLLMASTNMP